MTTLGNRNKFPVDAVDRRTTIALLQLNIGATGAPTIDPNSSFGFTVVRDDAGEYTLTHPAVPAQAVIVPVVMVSATIASIVGTARNPQQGTFSFETLNAAGAATDPASGNVLGFVLFGWPSSEA